MLAQCRRTVGDFHAFPGQADKVRLYNDALYTR
jgi:hypothetical protein